MPTFQADLTITRTGEVKRVLSVAALVTLDWRILLFVVPPPNSTVELELVREPVRHIVMTIKNHGILASIEKMLTDKPDVQGYSIAVTEPSFTSVLRSSATNVVKIQVPQLPYTFDHVVTEVAELRIPFVGFASVTMASLQLIAPSGSL